MPSLNSPPSLPWQVSSNFDVVFLLLFSSVYFLLDPFGLNILPLFLLWFCYSLDLIKCPPRAPTSRDGALAEGLITGTDHQWLVDAWLLTAERAGRRAGTGCDLGGVFFSLGLCSLQPLAALDCAASAVPCTVRFLSALKPGISISRPMLEPGHGAEDCVPCWVSIWLWPNSLEWEHSLYAAANRKFMFLIFVVTHSSEFASGNDANLSLSSDTRAYCGTHATGSHHRLGGSDWIFQLRWNCWGSGDA